MAGGDVGRRAMVRRGAVTRWPATSQNGATALVAAAWRGHMATVEVLLDRGADLEAKDRVSAAAMCCFATGHAGCHGRVPWCGEGDDASGRRAAGRPAWEAALAGWNASRGATARRGAVSCWHAASQYGATALVAAARRGHKDTVELLVDRGADLEAKDRVSAAAVCCCATGHAGRHGRAWVRRWRCRVGASCCCRGPACEAALAGGGSR